MKNFFRDKIGINSNLLFLAIFSFLVISSPSLAQHQTKGRQLEDPNISQTDYDYFDAKTAEAGKLLMEGKTDEFMTIYKDLSDYCLDRNFINNYAEFQMALAEVHYMYDRDESALEILKPLTKIPNLNPSSKAGLLYRLGDIYPNMGDIETGSKYLYEALELATQSKDSARMGTIFVELGSIEQSRGKNIEAINHILKANDFISLKYVPSIYANNCLNLYELFVAIGNDEKALSYLDQAEEICNDNNLIIRGAQVDIFRGVIQKSEKNYTEAEALISKGVATMLSKKQSNSALRGMRDLADLHIKQGKFEKARKVLIQGDELLKNTDDTILKAFMHGKWSEYFMGTNNLAEAKKHLDLSEVYWEKINIVDIKSNRLLLRIKYQKAKNDYRTALGLMEKYLEEDKKLSKINQSNLTHDLEAKYQKVEQEKEIVQLSNEKEIAAIKLVRRNRLLWFSGIGLLLLGSLLALVLKLYRTNQDKSARLTKQNAIIEKALHEKNILLQEIHHRVKNNLQVISSLLGLQSRYVKDTGVLDAIKAGRGRVQSMSLLHQNLYQEDNLKGVDIKVYFENLCQNLFDTYHYDDKDLKLITDIDDINLDIDTVVPLGLIVNELVSNALKHAFEDVNKGEITIELKEVGNILSLKVKDNGKGLQSNELPIKSKSLGVKLIQSFAEKLDAEIKVNSGQGTSIELEIRQFKKAS